MRITTTCVSYTFNEFHKLLLPRSIRSMMMFTLHRSALLAFRGPANLASFKVILRNRCSQRAFNISSITDSLSISSRTEETTEALAEILAQDLRPGDCYCLHGDVGTGKTAFSRAFIRAAAGDPDLPVASPTYLLQNIYDETDGPPIHHFDLYRLSGGVGLERLDLSLSLATAVSLFEWPDRLSAATPASRLDLHFSLLPVEEAEGDGGGTLATEDMQEELGRQVGPASKEGELSGGGAPLYEDTRGRIIRLEPQGDAWRQRIESLSSLIPSHPVLSSCVRRDF
eukprot:jgi/Botrbrau1/14221/Bobra.0254s0010.1